jgi:DNA-binding CsgD family transcriptional regulator
MARVYMPFGVLRALVAGRMVAAMEELRSRDLRHVLEFVETAWAVAGEHAFTDETLAALVELVPSDLVDYCDLDRVRRCALDYVEVGDTPEDNWELFWRIADEHPLCHHQQAYADFSATRLSDVISRPRLVNSRIYSEWFRPSSVAAELEVGIAPSRIRTRNFILDRTHGDFSERDRAVLDAIRPHLCRIHEMTELRRAVGDSDAEDLDRLTDREAEILELVAAGLTNAGIAERLWISPGTVKKHLENVYAKLGVANRTAAVTAASRSGR